ncbi:signal peptidase I [Actinokineospora iranica]|uniref:signal peptidase I n=1 Tax=Actinokineospora iranica TaxID=1271860 RepID=UPI002B4B3FD0|nr:signal peptidase I [Actinokineospora iranica]
MNGASANGVTANGETAYTDAIPRKPPLLPEIPELPEVEPAEPEFWFGPPLPEDSLPPAEGWTPVAPPPVARPTRSGEPEPPSDPSDWFPASATEPPVDTYARLGITPAPTSPQDNPGLRVDDLSAPRLSPDSPPAGPPVTHSTDVLFRPDPDPDTDPVLRPAAPESAGRAQSPDPEPPRAASPRTGPADTPDAEPADPAARHLTEPISRRREPVASADSDLTDLIPRVRAYPPAKPSVAPPAETSDETPVQRDSVDSAEEVEDRPKRGKHRRPPRRQPLWREILVLIGVALLLTFVIQHFVGRVYSIPSGSMEETLHGCPGCTGDRVFVDKIIYSFRDPEPGDVIVFEGPNTWTENDVKTDEGNAFTRGLRYVGAFIGIAPPNERDFVKRVIAVGGQTVECCDEQNRVLVNGKPLDEPYVYWENGGPDERQKFSRVTVPEGTLWVMGDNRANSSDSRFQGGGGVRGVVPLGKVIGKARYIVLPPSRWRGIGDHNPQESPDLAAAGWHQGIPMGIGLTAAWPVLWLSRRVKDVLTPRKAE